MAFLSRLPIEELIARSALPAEELRCEEPLAKHCSFQVGGPAEYYWSASREDVLQRLPLLCRELHIPLTLIGKGSNLLIADRGLRGLVVQVEQSYSGIEELASQEREQVIARLRQHSGRLKLPGDLDQAVFWRVYSGTSLRRLAQEAARESLTGLEAASGIPGSVGGAVFMNAGAYGQEMQDVLCQSRAIHLKDGSRHEYWLEEQDFAYRHSIYKREPSLILDALFVLYPDHQGAILQKMADFKARRQQTQPLDLPSAGSVFKRPEGHFAGKLIMDAGLQGYRIGGAEVSTKHAGFIVNIQKAKAEDVLALIEHVQRVVKAQYGVCLEPELRFLGWTEAELGRLGLLAEGSSNGDK